MPNDPTIGEKFTLIHQLQTSEDVNGLETWGCIDLDSTSASGGVGVTQCILVGC